MSTNFNEQFGTARSDSLSSTGFGLTTLYGLKGDDTLASLGTTGESFLMGGSGNDTYTLNALNATVVYDTSGVNTLNINLSITETYFALLEGRHLFFGSDRSDEATFVYEFTNSNTNDAYNFNDVSYTKGQLFNSLASFSEYYGNFSYKDLEAIDPTYTGAEFESDMAFIQGREAVFEAQQSAFTTDQAIEVARLYQAGFGRVPDENGMNFWIDGAENGVQLDDAELVNVLYTNVLGRTAEAEGFNYWVNVMQSGQVSDEQALMHFAASDENKQNTTYLNAMQYSDGDWVF